MVNTKYLDSVKKCIRFINTQMLSFDGGYYGIYERIRIDKHIRVNWVRPDCNAEYLRVLLTLKDITHDKSNDQLIEKIKNWLISAQDCDEISVFKGTFPFYITEGYLRENKSDASIYQNDNGKILNVLCQLYNNYGDSKYLEMAKSLADYFCDIQNNEGVFARMDGRSTYLSAKGPCFVHWPVSGLYRLYGITGNNKYFEAAEKGIQYVMGTILPNGRSKTTYELIHREDWRPVSSETAMACYCFGVAYKCTNNIEYRNYVKATADFILQLQDENGAILNCDETCMGCSLQSNTDLADLVYTQGFALQALIQAYECTNDEKYLAAAHSLAEFLVSIQCKNESPLWDGGWRGSYNVHTSKWDGRADQNNPIDEGGMYSVYTGWCCTNIMFGLLKLVHLSI